MNSFVLKIGTCGGAGNLLYTVVLESYLVFCPRRSGLASRGWVVTIPFTLQETCQAKFRDSAKLPLTLSSTITIRIGNDYLDQYDTY